MGGGRARQRRRGRADVVARPRSHRRFLGTRRFARTTRGRAIRNARRGTLRAGQPTSRKRLERDGEGARARVGRGDHAFGRSDADRTEIVHDKDERFFPHRSGFERKPPRLGRRRDFFSLSTRVASQTRRNPRLFSPHPRFSPSAGFPESSRRTRTVATPVGRRRDARPETFETTRPRDAKVSVSARHARRSPDPTRGFETVRSTEHVHLAEVERGPEALRRRLPIVLVVHRRGGGGALG